MGGHQIPGQGTGDDGWDEEGYDESQRAEILEATRDGPTDGLVLTDLNPDLGDDDAEDEGTGATGRARLEGVGAGATSSSDSHRSMISGSSARGRFFSSSPRRSEPAPAIAAQCQTGLTWTVRARDRVESAARGRRDA